jgi:hypothetical protein
MKTLDLFKEPAARSTDPETSVDAADDANRFAKGNRLRALRLLHIYGPQTDFELAAKSGLQQTSIGKRRGECAQRGYVEKLIEFGDVVKRPAPSGSAAIVWQINESGIRLLNSLT